jgi:hypothetical protein
MKKAISSSMGEDIAFLRVGLSVGVGAHDDPLPQRPCHIREHVFNKDPLPRGGIAVRGTCVTAPTSLPF